jgi:hypothetical protein
VINAMLFYRKGDRDNIALVFESIAL